jgi:hypothetical protein
MAQQVAMNQQVVVGGQAQQDPTAVRPVVQADQQQQQQNQQEYQPIGWTYNQYNYYTS